MVLSSSVVRIGSVTASSGRRTGVDGGTSMGLADGVGPGVRVGDGVGGEAAGGVGAAAGVACGVGLVAAGSTGGVGLAGVPAHAARRTPSRRDAAWRLAFICRRRWCCELGRR